MLNVDYHLYFIFWFIVLHWLSLKSPSTVGAESTAEHKFVLNVCLYHITAVFFLFIPRLCYFFAHFLRLFFSWNFVRSFFVPFFPYLGRLCLLKHSCSFWFHFPNGSSPSFTFHNAAGWWFFLFSFCVCFFGLDCRFIQMYTSVQRLYGAHSMAA